METKLRNIFDTSARIRIRKNMDNNMLKVNNTVTNKKIVTLSTEAKSLTIGDWKFQSEQALGLMAKWYFGRRKLIWEIIEKGLKRKIEIRWSDILATRAFMNENHPGIFKVLLKARPLFFEETPTDKNVHTIWKKSFDFTNNAQRFGLHSIEFAPGILERDYPKLLEKCPLFLQLSECPFEVPPESPLVPPSERQAEQTIDQPYRSEAGLDSIHNGDLPSQPREAEQTIEEPYRSEDWLDSMDDGDLDEIRSILSSFTTSPITINISQLIGIDSSSSSNQSTKRQRV